MKISQRGFALLTVLLIATGVLIVGGAGYWWYQNQTTQTTSTTNFNYDVGFKVTGYYTSFLQEAWEQTKQCDAFVITGEDQEFIKHFSDAVENGDIIKGLKSSGQLIFPINLVGTAKNDLVLIKNSNITSPVTLTIRIPLAKITGIPVCFSFVKIISAVK